MASESTHVATDLLRTGGQSSPAGVGVLPTRRGHSPYTERTHLFDIDYQLPTSGNRHCGRTIPGFLSLAGYKDIVLEKVGINTCSLTHEERETLFRFNYDFIKAGLETTVKKDPNNREMQNHLNWVIKMGDEMENES